MRNLLDFAQRRDVRDVVAQATNVPSVQGVIVDYDPWWLDCWRLYTWCDRDNDKFERFIYPRRFPYWQLGIAASWNIGLLAFETPNLGWTPPFWNEYRELRGWPDNYGPIVLKVCFYPPEHRNDWRPPKLDSQAFAVIFEVRPVARFAMSTKTSTVLKGGASIFTSEGVGTLGGLIKDAKGTTYGITCAHVAQSQQTVEAYLPNGSQTSQVIGACQFHSPLVSSGTAMVCNPFAAETHINTMDASIVALAGAVQAKLEVEHIGPLSRVTAKTSLTPGMPLDFVGKASGHARATVGGLGVTYRLRDHNSGDLHCLKGMFEIRKPSPSPLLGFGPAIPHLFNSPVSAGDSGAWLCDGHGPNYGWAGQVIGDDGLQGLALFSDDVKAWIDSHLTGAQL